LIAEGVTPAADDEAGGGGLGEGPPSSPSPSPVLVSPAHPLLVLPELERGARIYMHEPKRTIPEPTQRELGGGGGALSTAAEKTNERNLCTVSTTDAVSPDVVATRLATERDVV
jgi:hypothetical protein